MVKTVVTAEMILTARQEKYRKLSFNDTLKFRLLRKCLHENNEWIQKTELQKTTRKLIKYPTGKNLTY